MHAWAAVTRTHLVELLGDALEVAVELAAAGEERELGELVLGRDALGPPEGRHLVVLARARRVLGPVCDISRGKGASVICR